MSRTTPRLSGTLSSLAFAAIAIVVKLSIASYGLPLAFNADELYILKDPFKLTYRYLTGDVSSATNLFFWVVQLWYGLVFLGGWLAGQWRDVAEFRDLLVGESPSLLLWGRVLGVLLDGAGVFVLCEVVRRVVRDHWVRLFAWTMIALNPIALVSSAWLKFDGVSFLFNALLISMLARMSARGERTNRRPLYVMAMVAFAVRPDLVIVLLCVVVDDLLARRPLKEVLPAMAFGAVAYGVITLWPLVVVQKLWGDVASPHGVLLTANSFEENIARRLFLGLSPAEIGGRLLGNLRFYGWVALALGPIPLLACWPGFRRERVDRLNLAICFALLLPIVTYPFQATRYFLLPSAYLVMLAARALDGMSSACLRGALLVVTALWVGSLSVETVVTLRSQADSRLEGGRYMIAGSAPTDVVAIEGYQNPGMRAEISECSEDLVTKAQLIKTEALGTGQTLLLKSRNRPEQCRRVLEIDEVDRFSRTPFRGLWINTYDAELLLRVGPRFISAGRPFDASIDGEPRAGFARALADHYLLDRVFEPQHWDFRVRRLLVSTPYWIRVVVYRRRQ